MGFDFSRLKDPGYYQENRVAAHSDHIAYPSKAACEQGVNPLRLSLNGLWKFHYALNEGQVISGFEAADYDCSGWADIVVPAHVQMEGYGAPQYANTQYPWDGVEGITVGEIPTRFNPVASYIKTFYLPEGMKGKRVYVSFQGAESCLALWVNGQYVGFSSDSFDQSDFELTPYLVEGQNRIACRVYRYCSGSWLEDQDFMRFSGLFREVYLYATPAAHLRDLHVKTLLDDDFKGATLDVTVDVEGDCAVRMALTYDGADVVGMAVSGEGQHNVRMPVALPKLWSSDTPRLYNLDISLVVNGVEVEFVRQKVGFRRVEIKGSVMYLNGQRIVFKGVNRHDYCAETGRVVTPEKLRRDLLTMKRNNINAIRTSHYPNNSFLYAMCDELGLYVIDENNMETHGVWNMIQAGDHDLDFALPGNRADWQDILLDRVNSVFQRDKNHACVVMWSCGNESLGGDVIWEMSELFRKLDGTRPVHYEGICNDRRRNATSDVESQMYTPLKKIKAFLAEHRDKPFILCEYTHSMGNSNGAMHCYTEYAYEEPLYQGGFIWDYLDQSIRVKNRYGQTRYAYGGDYDDRPSDYNFCGNGIVYGDGSESPKTQEVKYNYQDIVAEVDAEGATVYNRSMFLNTDVYDCVATLARDGEVIATAPLAVSVAPLKHERVTLPFPAQTRGGEYAVTLSFRLKEDKPWAERGYEVAFAQGVYKVAAQPVSQVCAPLRVVYGTSNLGVQGEHFSVLFTYLNGGISSYRYGGVEMLKTIPMPNFWRAPVDNDRGNGMPARYGQWKLASMYVSQKRSERPPVTEHKDGSVSIRFDYALPTTPSAECSVTYRVHPCGRVDATLDYQPVEGLGDMPEYGLLMRLDADYNQVRYYGLGPAENYIDRHQGAKLGVFRYDVTKNISHYLKPQECGARTGVRWAEVTDYRGRGLRFTGDGMTFSALPYTPHELENALHEDELPPIHYTVVRPSLAQMGVAGDDSWGARTHEEYLIDVSKPLSFTFSFEGIV